MKKDFEHIVRDKFSDYSSEVSPDLFDKIMAGSQAKKRRFAWFWSANKWWAAAAIILLAAGAFYLIDLSSTEISTENDITSVTVDEKLSDAPENNGETLKEVNEAHAENTSNSFDRPSSSTHSTNKTSSNVTGENKSNVNDGRTETPRQSANNEGQKPKTNNTLALEESDDKKGLNPSDNVDDIEEEMEMLDLPEQIANVDDKSNDVEETDDLEVVNAAPDTIATPAAPIPVLPLKSKWSIDLFAGPGFAYRNMSGDQAWVNARNSTEKAKLSYQFNIGLAYQLRNNFKVSTGIRYTKRNESFAHSTNWTTYDSTITSKDVKIYNPALGQYTTITVADTSINSINNYKNYSSVNRYSVVSIPLEIEKSFHIKDWSVLTKAGVMMGLSSSQTGYRLDEKGNVISISDTKTPTVTNINAVVALGVAYRINPHISVLFYPHLNYGIGSSIDKSAGLIQRDYGIYSHFGMRIDF